MSGRGVLLVKTKTPASSGGSGNGIGLKNVQDRIQIAFGGAYGIEVASQIGCYTKIIVRIPMTHRGEAE